MSNNLTVFQNEQFGQVRTIDEKGKVYFLRKRCGDGFGVCGLRKSNSLAL